MAPFTWSGRGSIEAIVAAKQELVEALPADGVAISKQRQCPHHEHGGAYQSAGVPPHGLNRSADLWASNIESMGLEGIRFTLHRGREALNVQVPLLGAPQRAYVATGGGGGSGDVGLSWEKKLWPACPVRGCCLRLVAASGARGLYHY
ncbi:MAG: hypothetical protein M5U34_33155 [Chloroflexi bacterium]|nr:hypothetical protein [Chloroflexota bacterium]